MLNISNISITFNSGTTDAKKALSDLSIKVNDGDFITVIGANGAGKSTLLNTLTDAQVFAEDKLFATLDPTSRAITLDDNRKILLVDTVGFIRKLPHHLIEAFKSTLEEAQRTRNDG